MMDVQYLVVGNPRRHVPLLGGFQPPNTIHFVHIVPPVTTPPAADKLNSSLAPSGDHSGPWFSARLVGNKLGEFVP